MKGLLFKSTVAFFLIAFTSFYLSYLYSNYTQEQDIKNEFAEIKQQDTQALDIILSYQIEQLTSFSEEILLAKQQHAIEQGSYQYLSSMWPRIKMSRHLTSLYVQSDEESLLLGNEISPFLLEQAKNAKDNLMPYHQMYCEVICEIAVSIPIRINGKTQSLTLTSRLLPSIIYASQSLNMDIGLVNQTQSFAGSDISQSYPLEAVTNVNKKEKLLGQLADLEVNISTILEGHFQHNSLTDEDYLIWGNTIGEVGREVSFLFIKDVTSTLEKYNLQKQSLLFHSATISFGIIIVIVILVYSPLKKLRQLTQVIEKIGAKKYRDARALLGKPKVKGSGDELDSLSHAMYTALHRIEEYEEKIIVNQKALKNQATIDGLTQLFNRNAFIQHLTILQESYPDCDIALALIDLDGFKPINDNMGHEAGDEVLKQVGTRLASITTDKITPFRLGGDEFVVCIETSIANTALYNRLVSLFTDDFSIFDSTKVNITGSIGVTIGNLRSHSHSELLRQADVAMYEAKKSGKNQYSLFKSSMMDYSNLRFTITNDFVSALRNGDIFLHFQPIVDSSTGKTIKLEALSRWKHPQAGFIRPDIFIPVIEGTAYIHELSEWLILQCIAQLAKLRVASIEDISISINISAAQISDKSSISFIKEQCDRFNVPCHLIELEITETSLIANFDAAKEWLHSAQEEGFKVSIDDFGTGYSSLSYLTFFPFNTVKVDRSLINSITTDLNQRKVTKSIIRMLNELDVDVVVEGVEFAEQLEVLQQLGANVFQGYYYSKPLDKASLKRFLNLPEGVELS